MDHSFSVSSWDSVVWYLCSIECWISRLTISMILLPGVLIFWMPTPGRYLWFLAILCIQLVNGSRVLLMSNYWVLPFMDSQILIIIIQIFFQSLEGVIYSFWGFPENNVGEDCYYNIVVVQISYIISCRTSWL